MKDYSFLLKRNEAQVFLNKNANEIFGQNDLVKLISIKQSKTYNPEACNLLYQINRNDQDESLRVSSSKIFSKKHDYLVMKYFYDNGFNNGSFLSPKPLAFFEKENLLFYENVEGEILHNLLNKKIDSLSEYIKKSSQLLKKIHSLSIPNFTLFDVNLFFKNFNFKSIILGYPKLKNMPNIVRKIEDYFRSNLGKDFCHGDFNPNNIVLTESRIYIIDFGLTCVFNKEVDLASFLTHLKIMLHTINQDGRFDILKDNFINNYGKYDKEKLNLLIILIDLRLLEIAINYKQSDYDESFVYLCLKEDLYNIKLK